jgi:L-ascorbate metabolism protein UlaG (beta-lactamase superfamily)
MGFVVYADPGVRFYHYGDTAIFSDLKLIGRLYQPTIGCIGITNPIEALSRITGPGQMLTAEMSSAEGALAARWLGLETVLPCHYVNPDCEDVREFVRYIEKAQEEDEGVPKAVVLKPGEAFTIE